MSSCVADTLFMRRSQLILAAAALVTAVSASTAGAVNGTSCWTPTTSEKGFVQQMNAARSSGGSGTLKLDPELSKVARVHTNEMVKKNELHHTPTQALTRRVTNWVSIGENVGVGGTVASLQAAFMASPTHKANIMSPSFNHVGVGTRQVGDTLWVTVVFEARTDPGTTLPMPSC